ncbi:MAG: outer membrane protein assembly factor BamD [Proteobacteria bacterium]|nr:outer membrane protein assembly factor BamD [Pseudomonadota bacterium]
MNHTRIIVAVLLSLVVSCSKNQDADSLLDYSQTAERFFQLAMDEFDDEDCISAEKIFQTVQRKFPYSRFAVLAELRLADCQFLQDNHSEAAVSYEQFVRAHPTHEEAHYASYRRGLSFYEMIPSDWIILPPPHERDQAATRDARDAFSRFVETYPRSPWLERAVEMLDDVEDSLLRHEMYVADFYLSREDRLAAAVRLEGIRAHFPKSNLVPDAMLMQAITFLKMNEFAKAKHIFTEIIDHFPEHHQSLRARDYLQHLDRKKRGAKRGNDG